MFSVRHPAAQIRDKPSSVRCAHRLSVAAALDQRLRIILAHNRIVGTRFKGLLKASGTRQRDSVSRACAALREDQIVVSVLLQQVRSLRRPLLISVPEKSCLGDLLRKIFIQLQNSSAAVQQHVMSSVIVVEQGRVDALLVDKHRLAVRSLRLFGRYDHLAPQYGSVVIQPPGRCDVKSSVAVGDVRRPEASSSLQLSEICPFAVCHRISDDLPVHEISGMRYRNTREVDKRGIHHIVILPDPHDGRVRIHSGPNRILIHMLQRSSGALCKVRLRLLLPCQARLLERSDQIPVSVRAGKPYALNEISHQLRISGPRRIVQKGLSHFVPFIHAGLGIFHHISHSFEISALGKLKFRPCLLRLRIAVNSEKVRPAAVLRLIADRIEPGLGSNPGVGRKLIRLPCGNMLSFPCLEKERRAHSCGAVVFFF